MSDRPTEATTPTTRRACPCSSRPWFERLQIKYINPLLRPLSKRMPGLGVIKHPGRTSGKDYETIVTPYRKGTVLAIGLAHGKTNWVKNVMAAGEADIQIGKKTCIWSARGCCPPAPWIRRCRGWRRRWPSGRAYSSPISLELT